MTKKLLLVNPGEPDAKITIELPERIIDNIRKSGLSPQRAVDMWVNESITENGTIEQAIAAAKENSEIALGALVVQKLRKSRARTRPSLPQ